MKTLKKTISALKLQLEKGNEDKALNLIDEITIQVEEPAELKTVLSSALVHAASKGLKRVIEYLLKLNADPEFDDMQPARMALMEGHIDVSERMLEVTGKDVNSLYNSFGWCAWSGQLDSMKWMIAQGYEITEDIQIASLYFALKAHKVDVLRYLVYDLGFDLGLLDLNTLLPDLQELGDDSLIKKAVAAHVASELEEKRKK